VEKTDFEISHFCTKKSGHTAYCCVAIIVPIYIPNFVEIEKTFCGRMDGRKMRLALLGRLIMDNIRTAHSSN